MIDIKFLRENPDAVRENIKKKFQDKKLPLVDEVIKYDKLSREAKGQADSLRAERNKLSKQIGVLMKEGKKDEAEKVKAQVTAQADKLAELEEKEKEYSEKVHDDMMVIPNIIDPSVPIGPDDSYNQEIERFGDPVVPDFPIPYHTDIMESFDGIDLDAAGKVAGNGFYYLLGDIARLHSAVLAYARDFMINKGFTYCIPPYMIHSAVVDGVMSFEPRRVNIFICFYSNSVFTFLEILSDPEALVGECVFTVTYHVTVNVNIASRGNAFKCNEYIATIPIFGDCYGCSVQTDLVVRFGNISRFKRSTPSILRISIFTCCPLLNSRAQVRATSSAC